MSRASFVPHRFAGPLRRWLAALAALAGGVATASEPGARDGAASGTGALAGAMLAVGGLGWIASRRWFAGTRGGAVEVADTRPMPDRAPPPAADPSAAVETVRPGTAEDVAATSGHGLVAGRPEPTPTSDAGTVLDVFRRLSRDTYWETDLEGRLVRVDDGATPSALRARLGRRRWDDGAVPLDAPDWTAHRERLERHEPFEDFAWVWVDPAGRVRVAIDAGVPRLDSEGRVVGYAGVSRDAGAEVVAERTRRLAVAALLAATEPVVWIEAMPGVDDGWHVVWANGAACRLFDRSERELRSLPWRAMFGPQSQVAAAGIGLSLRARRECRVHVDLSRRYGEVRSVEMRLEPLPGDGSLRPCAALLMHDRSAEQERLREDGRAIARLREKMHERSLELEVTARELESFTYTVSHDLRAPIRVVEGFARILQEDYADRLDRVGHEHLQRVLTAATRMTQMIDALLGLSRLTNQPIVPEPVDLSRLADGIVEELRATEPMRRATFVVQPGMRVDGDRALLRAMLENLLGNAWKYTSRRPDARIEIACTGTGAEAVWCVSDDGEGFDMRFADRLFGVFQRLHSAADFPGTGVGLATVQRIVRRHGGRIWAESEPGRGARFYFTFWEKPAR